MTEKTCDKLRHQSIDARPATRQVTRQTTRKPLKTGAVCLLQEISSCRHNRERIISVQNTEFRIILIRLTVLMIQESAADKHSGLTPCFTFRSLPLNTEEPLDGIIKVRAVLLPVAIFITPLAIEPVCSRSTHFICLAFLQPRIHKLAYSIRLLLIFLIGGDNSIGIGKRLRLKSLISLITPVENRRLVLRRSKECLESFILFMCL